MGALMQKIATKIAPRRAFQATESYLRSVVDTVPEAVITIDARGRILSFNRIAQDMFGYTAAEVVGQSVDMLMDTGIDFSHRHHLALYRRAGEDPVFGRARRVVARRKDGTRFPNALFISGTVCEGRRVFTGFLRDLTAQEEADAHLHELQNELIRMSRISAAGTLAAALAHELNQPLTAIANYVQSCSALVSRHKGHVPKDLEKALHEAGREALRAGEIVHRLREFVSRGTLERQLVAPRHLADIARDLGAVGAKARNIKCTLRIAQDLPLVLVDEIHIQQVLLNLIRNGFEALTQGGEISISATRQDQMICFCVADNGPGIEPGKEDSIFEAFITGKADGMGMGLAICRTIVEAHGGRLWHAPVAGGGAAFYFTLPIAEDSHA